MADLRAFPGLRFNPQRVGALADVICPPYDVITPAEQAELHARSPYNLVQLELGLDERGDDERSNRYSRAADTLESWRAERALGREPRPAYYLHRAQFTIGDRPFSRRDLVAAVGLAPWDAGVVLPHERTMTGPKEDRLRLLRATATQLSPLWTLYRGESEPLAELWDLVLERPPQIDVMFEGVQHQIWAVSDPRLLPLVNQDFAARTLYIADGHHRYETALAYQRERRAASLQMAAESAPHDAVMSVVTSAEDPGLAILPIHRLIAGLPDGWGSVLHTRIGEAVEHPLPDDPALAVQQAEALGAERADARGHQFVAILDRGRTALRFALPAPEPGWNADRSAAWRSLDVAVLHGLVLEPLLERNALPAEQALTFTHSAAEALAALREGRAQLAILVSPTRVGQVLAVADAHDRMPQKSTFFVPKTPSGLVLYPMGEGS